MSSTLMSHRRTREVTRTGGNDMARDTASVPDQVAPATFNE